MKVILRKDLRKLGHKNDIVDVLAGYARNYLLPNNYAEEANESNRKKLAELMKQTAYKEAKKKKGAEKTAENLRDIKLVIPVKTDEQGNIFGSVNNVQIALALQKEGYEIDAEQVSSNSIKEIGTHNATIQIYRDIEVVLSFEVVRSTEEKKEK